MTSNFIDVGLHYQLAAVIGTFQGEKQDKNRQLQYLHPQDDIRLPSVFVIYRVNLSRCVTKAIQRPVACFILFHSLVI